ncbi:MAG: hypothetical protein LC799_24190 [Actinobacteria bacterium]|nr:hypothetical protein [Actinomycetota bacterium]
MEVPVTFQQLNGVPQVVWRPVAEFARWVHRVQEAAEHLTSQLRETGTLVLRILDGVAVQAMCMRARSQVELVFGSLTVSVTSGVAYARPGDAVADLMSASL